MILEVNKWPPGGAGVVLSWNTWNFSMIFGILCEHFGTVTQCSVDPTVPLSETLKKTHETSRKWIFFEFQPISMNFYMY